MAKVELKQPIVEEIANNIKDAQAVVLVDYSGLTVEQDTILRKELRESGAAVIIATVGMRFRASCSSRYSRRVASRAARVILSTRRARLSGFRLIFSMIAFVPTIIPACGPPSTLSPEKVTTSAPAATTERTVGSPGSPAAVKSRKLPLPRSSMSGRPCRCAMSASSSTGTSAWKPTTR